MQKWPWIQDDKPLKTQCLEYEEKFYDSSKQDMMLEKNESGSELQTGSTNSQSRISYLFMNRCGPSSSGRLWLHSLRWDAYDIFSTKSVLETDQQKVSHWLSWRTDVKSNIEHSKACLWKMIMRLSLQMGLHGLIDSWKWVKTTHKLWNIHVNLFLTNELTVNQNSSFENTLTYLLLRKSDITSERIKCSLFLTVRAFLQDQKEILWIIPIIWG